MPQYRVTLEDPINGMARSEGLMEAATPEAAAKAGIDKAWSTLVQVTGRQNSRAGWPSVKVSIPGKPGRWEWKISWLRGSPEVQLGLATSGGLPGQ